MENILMEIEHRICHGCTDIQIMEDLGIKERTFYYYKEKLYQQSAKIQAKKKTEQVLVFEMQILKDRLTYIYRHLEQRVTAGNTRVRDLIEIALLACNIAEIIFKLESEGLRALSGINKLASKASQQQSLN
jgi:hypothetical protein